MGASCQLWSIQILHENFTILSAIWKVIKWNSHICKYEKQNQNTLHLQLSLPPFIASYSGRFDALLGRRMWLRSAPLVQQRGCHKRAFWHTGDTFLCKLGKIPDITVTLVMFYNMKCNYNMPIIQCSYHIALISSENYLSNYEVVKLLT